ncbi:hypothetical protein GmHk_15G044356 [Glycine max]|nr:hypothetical protein GmHk_15G044356 [Glycine max]
MQVRFWWWLCLPAPATEMEEFGVIEPNRTEGTEPEEEPYRLSRVGELERFWKKAVERAEKVEVEDAKAVVAGDGRELRNLPAGESVRRTGPLDLLEAAAILERESELRKRERVVSRKRRDRPSGLANLA